MYIYIYNMFILFAGFEKYVRDHIMNARKIGGVEKL